MSDLQDLRDLQKFVLGCIQQDEATARAAGHGFGHQPIGAARNAGWTDIDASDNVRPSYDVNLIKTFSPKRVEKECQLKLFIIGSAPTRTQLRLTLARMAELYSDRPGYQERWSMEHQLELINQEQALPNPNN